VVCFVLCVCACVRVCAGLLHRERVHEPRADLPGPT